MEFTAQWSPPYPLNSYLMHPSKGGILICVWPLAAAGSAPSCSGPVRSSRVWQEFRKSEHSCLLTRVVWFAHCHSGPSSAPVNKTMKMKQSTKDNLPGTENNFKRKKSCFRLKCLSNHLPTNIFLKKLKRRNVNFLLCLSYPLLLALTLRGIEEFSAQ